MSSAFASMVITENTFDEVPEEVECPHELQHVWGMFRELDETRPNGGGMGGFNAITHTEITNWSEGLDVGVTSFERRCIRALDNAYRDYCNTKKD